MLGLSKATLAVIAAASAATGAGVTALLFSGKPSKPQQEETKDNKTDGESRANHITWPPELLHLHGRWLVYMYSLDILLILLLLDIMVLVI
jgi:hypothetical protein